MGNKNQIEKDNKILELSANSSKKLSLEQFEQIFKKLSKQSYILEKQIGEGNFGVVYEARIQQDSKINSDKDLKKFAIKLMKIDINQIKIKVLNEIEIQKKIQQKGCALEIYQVVQNKNIIAIVMELAQYSLKQFLKETQYNCGNQVIINFMFELLEGLKALEENKVIHFDIKPDNKYSFRFKILSKIFRFQLISHVRC
ncbi:hypothetical protein ABPG72_012019 [Tetrahymena utriculariae]